MDALRRPAVSLCNPGLIRVGPAERACDLKSHPLRRNLKGEGMKPLSMSVLLAGLMACASFAGIAARPSHKAVEVGRSFSLETTVPTTFGEWSEVRQQAVQVVNPQTQELLDKLYS